MELQLDYNLRNVRWVQEKKYGISVFFSIIFTYDNLLLTLLKNKP